MVDSLKIRETAIPGLFEIDLVIHGDERGSFREAWQNAKLTEQGLPELKPVQFNISQNNQRGITRGIHAEPWEKYITVAAGEVFAAIVDFRKPNFAKVETFKLNSAKAIFVPRGCGNSYQVLSDQATYCYLVNEHWQAGVKYPAVNCNDPDLDIKWPIPLSQAILSDKDQANPSLKAAFGEHS